MMLLLGIATYVSILACVWMLSAAYAAGGVSGIVSLVVWVFICGWIAIVLNNNGRDEK